LSPVALTFDDGPDPEWTPQVLDVLGRAGVSATFFVVAEQIAEPGAPEVLAAMMDAGHSIQPHCSRHLRHTELTLDELRADIAGVLDALAEHAVPEPWLWRPPYGALHPQHSAQVAAEVGLKLELWSHDPRDYSGSSAGEMLASLTSLDADAVILLHDSRRYAHATDSATNTIELIEPLVALIRERGYEIAALAN
jgi:peptidoglycan/xylan/chitin deacetylase (PgdA/CDA1 family)